MLIDEFMPEYDFSETHDVRISAAAGEVFDALHRVDLCAESAIVRWLFRLRGLPSKNVTLRGLSEMRFATLGADRDRELLLGLAGKFWTATGNLKEINSNNFRAFNETGCAKAVWNFSLDASAATTAASETQLTTETRIRCLDAESRAKFKFYWMLIQPFSALIRKEILRAIKRRAEKF